MPGKTYHHGDLRRLLVEATYAAVEADGPEAVTISRIAKQCGVSVAAPYRHFDDKADLLGAVAAVGFERLSAASAEAAAAQADGRERLVAVGVAYVEFAVAHPHLFRLMFTADLRGRQHGAGPAALAALAGVVEPLELRVPNEVAVRATWALAHGLAQLRLGGMLTFTREDSEHRLREELETLLYGIVTG